MKGTNTEPNATAVMSSKKKQSSSSPVPSDSPSHPPDSPLSPLRFHTPPYASPAASPNHHPRLPSPSPSPSPPPPPPTAHKSPRSSPLPYPSAPPAEMDSTNSFDEEACSPPPPPVVMVNREVKARSHPSAMGRTGRGGSVTSVSTQMKSIEGSTRMVALGFRVCEVVLCLISFSVMASDKTQGWTGDSYDRYKEYRYCLAVNVIGFVYALFQAYDTAFRLRKLTMRRVVQYYFEFFMDQMLAYLLISASSAAASRVEDWKLNWGSDKFTNMAGASVAMSFLAFFAFAISALLSGYNLSAHGFP